MWQTFGHQNQKLFLDNVFKSAGSAEPANLKLSHAYLFCGPSQIGKHTLALEFANKILGVQDSTKINPDLILVDGKEAKIEQMRELMNSLAFKPYQYSKKIAIIDNFEYIGPEAANSILKTLEEPNDSSILILITQNRESVLPTIVSRCQVIYFSRLSKEEIAKHSVGKSAGSKSVNIPESLINGKIGKVFAANLNPKLALEYSEQQQLFSEIQNTEKIKRLGKIKELAEKESDELAELFESWLDIEQYNFLNNAPQKYSNVQLLLESLQALKQNLNKKLILQKLFLNLS